jgi:hypothetical protein
MDIGRLRRRSEIRMRCPCRTLDGVPIEIELLNLSERGCLARSVGFPLQFGQALRLFPEGCDEFTATVRRSENGICGIEFDRELPIQVFERMRCYVPPPEEEVEETLAVHDAEPATAVTSEEAIEIAPANPAMPQAYGSLLATGRKHPTKKMAIS